MKPEEEPRMRLRGVCSHTQWDGRSFEDTKHAILDKKVYPLSETLDRLARLASELKVYRASLPKSGSKSKADPIIKARKLYGKIFSVEYSDMAADPNLGARAKLRLQRSFTVLDWKLLKRLTADTGAEAFDFETVEQETKVSMCLNVLPSLQNVLHYIGAGKILDPETIE
jgi:hypothetical protein